MMKILLPPLGTKIEPAGGIFLSSLERAPNTLGLPTEHPHGVGRGWVSYYHNYPGLLGEEFFQCCDVFMCKKKMRSGNQNNLKGIQCLCSNLGYSIRV